MNAMLIMFLYLKAGFYYIVQNDNSKEKIIFKKKIKNTKDQFVIIYKFFNKLEIQFTRMITHDCI